MTTSPVSSDGDVEARAGWEIYEKTSAPTLSMGGRRDFPESLGERSSHVVDFDGAHDVWNPKNWRTGTKSATKYHTPGDTVKSDLSIPGCGRP